MAYRYLTTLADDLRAAGLTVVELDGWKTRGRPASTGNFDPVGVLWHHTGGASDGLPYARWMGIDGRSDLPAPLCQLSIGRDGTVYVLAAGRANHAGTAKASGSVAAGDGNALYLGVECHNTGTEGWGAAQYDAMVKVGAVLGTKTIGCTVKAQRAHRETSVTGKWDPGLLNMRTFRRDIKRAMVPEPTASTLTGVFAALRYDAPAADRIAYLVAAVNERDADHLTADEAQGIRRRALRRALGPEWAVRRRGEYVTAWKRSRFTARGLARLAQITAIPGLADWRNTRAFKVPLRDRATGRPILVHVAHYPAGVEYGDTYRTDAEYAAQVAASRGALDKVGAGVRRRARRNSRLVQLITGDFNLDQHRQPWATLMQRALGAESVWTGRLPKGGDHGPRLISNVFVTGEGVIITDAALIKAPRPDARLDHKAIRYAIEIQED